MRVFVCALATAMTLYCCSAQAQGGLAKAASEAAPKIAEPALRKAAEFLLKELEEHGHVVAHPLMKATEQWIERKIWSDPKAQQQKPIYTVEQSRSLASALDSLCNDKQRLSRLDEATKNALRCETALQK